MTVEAIKEAIAGLPQDQKVSFATWLSFETMDDWDREMQLDFSPGGRGRHLVEKVKAKIRAGSFGPMSVRRLRRK